MAYSLSIANRLSEGIFRKEILRPCGLVKGQYAKTRVLRDGNVAQCHMLA